MRNTTTRLMTALLALVAVAGLATAAPSLPHHPCDLPTLPQAPALPEVPQAPAVPTVPVSAGCDASTDAEAGEHDASATSTVGDAAAGANADLTHTGVDEAAEEASFFAWFSVTWSAFIGKLSEVLGLAGAEAPSVDGGLEASLGTDGASVDLGVGGANVSAEASVPAVETPALPETPAVPETPALPEPAGSHVEQAKGKAKGLVPSLG